MKGILFQWPQSAKGKSLMPEVAQEAPSDKFIIHYYFPSHRNWIK